jgi:hypothetical protein
LNSVTTIPDTAIQFGGVYLNAVAGKPSLFRYNTVYKNSGPGLVCGGAYPVKGVLVAGNSTAEVVMCNFEAASSQVPGVGMAYDPKFDVSDSKNPYRLSLMSPCVDRGSTTDFPPDDIDGKPRPSPAGRPADCGAHEYAAPP